jgi:hypothetical protein
VQDAQACAVGEGSEHEIDSWLGHELYSLRRI